MEKTYLVKVKYERIEYVHVKAKNDEEAMDKAPEYVDDLMHEKHYAYDAEVISSC